MKSIYMTVLIGLLFSSCSKEEESNTNNGQLVSKWQLIEQLLDPGDGSGTFSPVTSQKTIELFSNGTWTSNGNLCSLSIDISQSSTGTYSTVDSTITVAICGWSRDITFEHDNNALILSYPCFEPCQEKYIPLP